MDDDTFYNKILPMTTTTSETKLMIHCDFLLLPLKKTTTTTTATTDRAYLFNEHCLIEL